MHAVRSPHRRYVVGTKMVFAGLKKDAERADLIAYLSIANPRNPRSLTVRMSGEESRKVCMV